MKLNFPGQLENGTSKVAEALKNSALIRKIATRTRLAILIGAGSAAVACGLDTRGSGEDLFGPGSGGDGGAEVSTPDAMGVDSTDFPDGGSTEAGTDAEVMADAAPDVAPDALPDADVPDVAIDAIPDVDVVDAASDADTLDATVDADADADPCAPYLGGFTVTVKALPGNQYDYVLYDDKGAVVTDSLGDGVDETTDNVISGVKYGYVLVQQSKSSTGGSASAEFAAEHLVSTTSSCIAEDAKRAPELSFATLSSTEFKALHDTCSGCSTLVSTATKPLFHYQYKAANPSYKSTVYHITFKKP